MKRLAIIAGLIAVALGIAFVIGVPDNAQASVGQTAAYQAPAPNAVAANGSNVTEVNVSGFISTQKWQGFWGNISGGLTLGDGTDSFYNWTSVTFRGVFASPGNTVDWSTVTDINTSAGRQAKDVEYGYIGSETDSINLTMTGSACRVGTVFANASGVYSNNASDGQSVWETCIGEDAGAALDDTVFGTTVANAGSNGYQGVTSQYQLMVPVQAAGDDYFFYVEI